MNRVILLLCIFSLSFFSGVNAQIPSTPKRSTEFSEASYDSMRQFFQSSPAVTKKISERINEGDEEAVRLAQLLKTPFALRASAGFADADIAGMIEVFRVSKNVLDKFEKINQDLYAIESGDHALSEAQRRNIRATTDSTIQYIERLKEQMRGSNKDSCDFLYRKDSAHALLVTRKIAVREFSRGKLGAYNRVKNSDSLELHLQGKYPSIFPKGNRYSFHTWDSDKIEVTRMPTQDKDHSDYNFVNFYCDNVVIQVTGYESEDYLVVNCHTGVATITLGEPHFIDCYVYYAVGHYYGDEEVSLVDLKSRKRGALIFEVLLFFKNGRQKLGIVKVSCFVNLQMVCAPIHLNILGYA